MNQERNQPKPPKKAARKKQPSNKHSLFQIKTKARFTPFNKTMGYKVIFPGSIKSLKGIKTSTLILNVTDDRVDMPVVLTLSSFDYFECIQERLLT